MTDRPADTTPAETAATSTGKVPGRDDYKGLYRADPAALTPDYGTDVTPPVSTGLRDLLSGIDGTDHGRRRVYTLSDEQVEPEPCAVVLDPTDADDDSADDDSADEAVLVAESDEAEGMEL